MMSKKVNHRVDDRFVLLVEKMRRLQRVAPAVSDGKMRRECDRLESLVDSWIETWRKEIMQWEAWSQNSQGEGGGDGSV